MKVADIEMLPPKILLYGEVGVGKTALALTLGAKAQVLDLDGGLRTGLSITDSFRQDRMSVDVKSFRDHEPHKRAKAFAALKTAVYEIHNDLVNKRYQFKALIVDSLSSLADLAVNYVMFNSGKLGASPEIQHWGIAFTEIKNVLSVIYTLPIPVVVIAHEQVKTVGSGAAKRDTLEIAIQGKNLPAQICRYFDEIWYMRSRPIGGGKFQYVLQTVNDDLLAARSRACLPNYTDTACGMWKLLEMVGYKEAETK